MNEYLLGKDIAKMLEYLERLEKKVDRLADEIGTGQTDEKRGFAATRGSNDQIDTPMENLQAGPGFVRGAVISVYRSGLWQAKGSCGNESRHSTSELSYLFQVRNAEGTFVLLEIYVFGIVVGPGGGGAFDKGGSSPSLAGYYDGLGSGANSLWHRLSRRRID